MKDLLLLIIDGQHYGIWKEDVEAVREIQSLHRLPLSPACIAGISILDGRTVTLADLTFCIGNASGRGKESGHILLMPGSEKLLGFMVGGGIETLSVSADSVFPLPQYLSTPVIQSCLILGNAPVPIINIIELVSWFQKGEQESPRPTVALPAAGPSDTGSSWRLRCFVLAGELYAAPVKDTDEGTVVPGPITTLSLVPQYVKGVMFREKRLVPIIDLAQRIAKQQAGPQAGMVAAEICGTSFGLLVDREEEIVTADVTIKDLPPIVSLPWMRKATVKAGQVIPLIDLGLLLSDHSGEELPALHERYRPDSPAGNLFTNQDVDIVEFSLLGVRHALPKSEVKDIFGIKRFHTAPDAPEIVIGIAEHDGEVLPVLDLAAPFGRRSMPTADWRMILVENGDFQALVITEGVFGERRLSCEIQRRLPILLPHTVVYGCYPDSEAVRLVLNVEAIAVHFEKSLLSHFFPELSQEMRESPPAFARPFIEQETREAAAMVVTQASSLETAPSAMVEEPSSVEDRTGVAPERIEEHSEVEQEKEKESTHESIEPVQEVESIAVSSSTENEEQQSDQECVTAPDQTENVPSLVTISESPDEFDNPVPDSEKTESPAAEMPLDASGAAELASDDGNRNEQESEQESETEEQEQIEPVSSASSDIDILPQSVQEQDPNEEKSQPAPVLAFSGSTEKKESVSLEQELETEEQEQIESVSTAFSAIDVLPQSVQEQEPIEEKSQPAPVLASAASAEKKESVSLVQERISSTGRDFDQTSPGFKEQSPKPASRRGGLFYAAIAGALVCLVVIGMFYSKTDNEKPGAVAPPLPAKSTTPELPGKIEEREPSLVVDVPTHIPVDADVYEIKKGDTLWSISERFTGNPFNYPRIAGENKLANPDLIFPGKKIRLVKKQGHPR